MGAQSDVEPPSQMMPLPLMVQDGGDFTVTVLLQTLLQPLAPVTVTEYVPAALTVTQRDVAPVFHKYV